MKEIVTTELVIVGLILAFGGMFVQVNGIPQVLVVVIGLVAFLVGWVIFARDVTND